MSILQSMSEDKLKNRKYSLTGIRGRKLYLDCEDAFALMSRLSPKINPVTVLSKAETIWYVPGMLAFVVSIIVSCVGNPFLYALVIPSSLIPRLFLIHKEWINFPIIKLLMIVSTPFNLLTGYGLFVGICMYFSYIHLGWLGILLYLASNGIRMVIDSRIELMKTGRYIMGHVPYMMYDSRCFILSYEHFANLLLVDSCVELSEEDVMKGKELLQQFKFDYPNIARRFIPSQGFNLPRNFQTCEEETALN